MGRKLKKGFDYFTLDTSFSDSVRLSILEIGSHGLSLLIELWQIIYGKHGYYMDFSDDCKILFLHSSITKVDLSELDRCLNIFFKRGVFSKDIYDKYKVLTSDSIQERYIETCIISKRVNNCMFEEYLLINKKDFETKNFEFKNLFGINTEEIQIYSEEIGINTEESTQSKVNETKLNKTKDIDNNIYIDAKKSKTENQKIVSNNDLENISKTLNISNLDYDSKKLRLTLFKENFLQLSDTEKKDFCNGHRMLLERLEQALNNFNLHLLNDKNSYPFTYSFYKEWFNTWLKGLSAAEFDIYMTRIRRD